jgi:hypothetical protein
MATFTVHVSQQAAGPLQSAEKARFVSDRFSWGAFLFAPFWLLAHRLWLAFAVWLLLALGVNVGLPFLGFSSGVPAAITFLLSVLLGLEGQELRRLKLQRTRWTSVDLVTAASREDAEMRFFRRRSVPVTTQTTPVRLYSGQVDHHGLPMVGLFPAGEEYR